jgi:adenylate kinase family enzyme
MRRVAIIGVSGSGKSWLAVRLGEALGLPVYHLDRLHWRPGWQPAPRVEWRALQEDLIQEPAWIIDGNYSGTLDVRLGACDTVIWLDLPTWICVTSVLWRYLKYRGRARPDLDPGCPERLDWEFLRYIATYRKRGRPRLLRALSELPPSRQVVHLTSRREMAHWLERTERYGEAQTHQGDTTWHSS